MKALVVYESMYGNTAEIGEAIAASLRAHELEVDAGPITRFAPSELAGFDLVVVGGPTHAHGMSMSATRKTAVEDQKNRFEEPTVGPGSAIGSTTCHPARGGSRRPSTRGSTSPARSPGPRPRGSRGGSSGTASTSSSGPRASS